MDEHELGLDYVTIFQIYILLQINIKGSNQGSKRRFEKGKVKSCAFLELS